MNEPRRIDRESDRPAYKQLADILREQIEVGELAGGANLPSKKQLAERFGVSITGVVEPALDELKAQGLIIMERGKLTRVRPTRVVGPSIYAAAARNYNPDQESRFAREHGVPFSQFDLSRVYTAIPAPPRIAEALHLAPGSPVVQRRWIHEVGGAVLRVSWSYLDEARFGNTILCDPDEPPWPGGTIAQLIHLGHRPVLDPPSRVRSRPATDEECELLQLDAGHQVLEEFRTHVEPGGVIGTWAPIEAAVRVYPWEGTVLVYNSVERREWPAWQG